MGQGAVAHADPSWDLPPPPANGCSPVCEDAVWCCCVHRIFYRHRPTVRSPAHRVLPAAHLVPCGWGAVPGWGAW